MYLSPLDVLEVVLCELPEFDELLVVDDLDD